MKKNSSQADLTSEFFQICNEEIIVVINKLFEKIEKKGGNTNPDHLKLPSLQ
jgi:hypothetical protein